MKDTQGTVCCEVLLYLAIADKDSQNVLLYWNVVVYNSKTSLCPVLSLVTFVPFQVLN